MDKLYYLVVASHNDQRACPSSFSLFLSVSPRAVFPAHQKYRGMREWPGSRTATSVINPLSRTYLCRGDTCFRARAYYARRMSETSVHQSRNDTRRVRAWWTPKRRVIEHREGSTKIPAGAPNDGGTKEKCRPHKARGTSERDEQRREL